MSDLSDMFKRAILAFTNASDFIGSFMDGGYMVVEDISDRMAVERKLNLAQGTDYFTINSEIEAAVSFYNKLTPSFFILQMSLLEEYLLETCQEAAAAKQIKFDQEPTGHFTVEQAKSFFETGLGIQFPVPWSTFEKVQGYQKLREQMVARFGLDAGSVNMNDAFLFGVNETLVLFFEELQRHIQDP